MSDFHQRGRITTLPQLGSREIGSREQELEKWSALAPVGLILPCTADDFFAPAMQQILGEISSAGYLLRIVISLNRASREQVSEAQKSLAARQDRRISLLWNDHPDLAAHLRNARVPDLAGKGFNAWTALGFLLEQGDCRIAVAHDCDIFHYRSEMVASLAYPLLHPEMGYDFVKGYYPRFSEEAGGQLFGRATRLFVGPLLRALSEMAEPSPLPDFLENFRYPLAGEVAGRLSWLAQCELASGWGLEIDLLCTAHHQLPPERIVQVDLGKNYEHRHRLSARDGAGLQRLAREIAASLLDHLARGGTRITPDFLATLRDAYSKNARETLRRYRHVAAFNGLSFPENEELALVEAFTESLSDPPAADLKRLPAWASLRRSHPAWCAGLFRLIDLSAPDLF